MHAAPGFFPIAIQCLCLQTLSLALLSVPCLALALLLQAMNVDVQTAVLSLNGGTGKTGSSRVLA